jgi:hypothetical protein
MVIRVGGDCNEQLLVRIWFQNHFPSTPGCASDDDVPSAYDVAANARCTAEYMTDVNLCEAAIIQPSPNHRTKHRGIAPAY